MSPRIVPGCPTLHFNITVMVVVQSLAAAAVADARQLVGCRRWRPPHDTTVEVDRHRDKPHVSLMMETPVPTTRMERSLKIPLHGQFRVICRHLDARWQ